MAMRLIAFAKMFTIPTLEFLAFLAALEVNKLRVFNTSQ
jgi:hypothetical protein